MEFTEDELTTLAIYAQKFDMMTFKEKANDMLRSKKEAITEDSYEDLYNEAVIEIDGLESEICELDRTNQRLEDEIDGLNQEILSLKNEQ